MYINMKLTSAGTHPSDRPVELSVEDETVLIELYSNEMWDYESIALSKQQALELAQIIMTAYAQEK